MKNKNNRSDGCVIYAAVITAFVLFVVMSSILEPYRKVTEPEPSIEAKEEVAQEVKSADDIPSDVQREFVESYNSVCSTPQLSHFETLYEDKSGKADTFYTEEDVSVLESDSDV